MPQTLDANGIVHVGFYQEMLLNDRSLIKPVDFYTVKDMQYLLPLVIDENKPSIVDLVLTKTSEKIYGFKFLSYQNAGNKWTLHSRGTLDLTRSTSVSEVYKEFDRSDLKNHGKTMDKVAFYQMMESRGIHLGESLRLVESVWIKENQLLARFSHPGQESEFTLPFDPGILDACAQLFHALIPEAEPSDLKMMVSKWGEFSVDINTSSNELWCLLKMEKNAEGKGTYTGDFFLENETGKVIAKCMGCTMQGVTDTTIALLREALGTTTDRTEESHPMRDKIQSASAEERKSIIGDFVLNTFSRLLKISPVEMNPKESIANFGIDSIIGLTFKKEVAQKLGIDLPIDEIVTGPSIEKLIQLIASLISSEVKEISGKVSGDSLWLVGEKKEQAKLRLFCFPYGGGGVSTFKDWQKQFPDTVEVTTIAIPGIEYRILENRIIDIYELTNALCDEIIPKLNLPFVFYGHSGGALLAYQVAKELKNRNLPNIDHLFVAAYTSPQIPNTLLVKRKAQFAKHRLTHLYYKDELSNEDISKICQSGILSFIVNKDMNPEAAAPYVKQYIDGYKYVDTYKYDDILLDCDITGFHSIRDDRLSLEDMEAWAELTTKKFELHYSDGDHFFINEPRFRDEVIAIILKTIRDKII